MAQTAKMFRKNQEEKNWQLETNAPSTRPSYMTNSSFSVFEGTSLVDRLYIYTAPFEDQPNFEDRLFHQSIKASNHQNIKSSKHQNIKSSKHQNIKTSDHQKRSFVWY